MQLHDLLEGVLRGGPGIAAVFLAKTLARLLIDKLGWRKHAGDDVKPLSKRQRKMLASCAEVARERLERHIRSNVRRRRLLARLVARNKQTRHSLEECDNTAWMKLYSRVLR